MVVTDMPGVHGLALQLVQNGELHSPITMAFCRQGLFLKHNLFYGKQKSQLVL